jgi:hypothetical protein
MRFMILVKATKDSESGVMPEEKLIAAMATYHEELAKAGAVNVEACGCAHGTLRDSPGSRRDQRLLAARQKRFERRKEMKG